MANKNHSDWFVAERSRALAVMYLTRRDDLIIREEMSEESGLDLIVQIAKDEFAGLRIFGVEVHGTTSPATDKQANKNLKPTVQSFLRGDDFYFPICVFYFTMADDNARFTWIAEPVITSEGQPKLERRTEAECRPLDNDALAMIVGQVDRWYEALGEALSLDRRL